MDNKQAGNIRLARDLDELMVWNFEKCRKGEGVERFKWLIIGYDGYSDIEVPKGAAEIWERLAVEYADLTSGGSATRYLILIGDISEAETRIKCVGALLEMLARTQNRQPFIDELAEWGFRMNLSKEFAKEMQRLARQLKAAGTKLQILKSEKETIEKQHKDGDILDLKIFVMKVMKMDFNLRKTSVNEWVRIVKACENEAKQMSKSKAVA